MIEKLTAYLRAYLQYIQTPKGRHDFHDDLWGFVVFILSTVLVMALVRTIWER